MLLDVHLAAAARRRPRTTPREDSSQEAPTRATPADASQLSILYVGPKDGTCLQRANALRELGHRVRHVRSGIPIPSDPTYQFLRVAHRIKRHPDIYLANSRLLRLARRERFDVVWIDKGLPLRLRTLEAMRRAMPGTRFLHYSPDDQFNPGNQSRRWLASIPFYDLHVTTKSYNVPELRSEGARDVLMIDNAFDPAVHRPLELTREEQRAFSADVGFVGAYERDRADLLSRLAHSGISVSIRGPGWQRLTESHPLLSVRDEWLDRDDYARAVNATRINLGFLRKANRDLQTQRSIEIPAMRAFLLAERTDEHQRLFREGKEAEFFDCFDELLAKCRYYLGADDARERVAVAGYRRCTLGGYSNQGRLTRILAYLDTRPRFVPTPARDLDAAALPSVSSVPATA